MRVPRRSRATTFVSHTSLVVIVPMSWLKSLTSKRPAPPAAAAAAAMPPTPAQPEDVDDFLSDALLPVEQVHTHLLPTPTYHSNFRFVSPCLTV